MNKLIIMFLLLSGCAMTEDRGNYIKALNEVSIGDSYQTMLDKIGVNPYDVNCYQSTRRSTCTAIYIVRANWSSIHYRFNGDNILVSIYH